SKQACDCVSSNHCGACGMPRRGRSGRRRTVNAGAAREYASATSTAAAMSYTVWASATVLEKMETQSSVRHAGTTPAALNAPRVGFSPTMLLQPAGTRPEPAVSVPSENTTTPRATTDAEPELDPPL